MHSRQELADTLRELTRNVEEKTRLAKAKDAESGDLIDGVPPPPPSPVRQQVFLGVAGVVVGLAMGRRPMDQSRKGKGR